jgi:hypothetical protein
MSHSPCGPNGTKWRRIAPLNKRLGQFELYSQKYTVSPIRGSWITPLLAPSSAKIRRERSPRRTLSADSIAQGSRRSPPNGGPPHSMPHRFQISQFAGATLASPAGCRSRRRSMPTTAVIGHLTFGLRSSCERAELMLALVTRVTPISTLADTFSPFEAASAVLTPS